MALGGLGKPTTFRPVWESGGKNVLQYAMALPCYTPCAIADNSLLLPPPLLLLLLPGYWPAIISVVQTADAVYV